MMATGIYFKVIDNAMQGDRIRKGDVVLINQLISEISNTDIMLVAVETNENPILRRVKMDGDSCILIPSNKSLKRERYNSNDVTIIGKVVELHIHY